MSSHVLLTRLALGTAILLSLASASLTVAVAHEGEEHAMECNEASMNEMKTDIQAMEDGEAKTTATIEMGMAAEMMGKQDMKACMDHMHKAMEAMEK